MYSVHACVHVSMHACTCVCACVPHLGHVAYKLRNDLLVHFSLHLHLAKLDISSQPSKLLHSNQ